MRFFPGNKIASSLGSHCWPVAMLIPWFGTWKNFIQDKGFLRWRANMCFFCWKKMPTRKLFNSMVIKWWWCLFVVFQGEEYHPQLTVLRTVMLGRQKSSGFEQHIVAVVKYTCVRRRRRNFPTSRSDNPIKTKTSSTNLLRAYKLW